MKMLVRLQALGFEQLQEVLGGLLRDGVAHGDVIVWAAGEAVGVVAVQGVAGAVELENALAVAPFDHPEFVEVWQAHGMCGVVLACDASEFSQWEHHTASAFAGLVVVVAVDGLGVARSRAGARDWWPPESPVQVVRTRVTRELKRWVAGYAAHFETDEAEVLRRAVVEFRDREEAPGRQWSQRHGKREVAA